MMQPFFKYLLFRYSSGREIQQQNKTLTECVIAVTNVNIGQTTNQRAHTSYIHSQAICLITNCISTGGNTVAAVEPRDL